MVFVPSKLCVSAALLVIAGFAAALPASVLRSAETHEGAQEKAPEPWTSAQVLLPADFVGQLGTGYDAGAPKIIYVGFRTLFEGGHIPGASFYGTASKEEGLAELKKRVAAQPRAAAVVIYCGCCPFDRCPNIRPAYAALRDMGFTHIRVLVLPTSFAADWVEKGYPMQKGL
jgi:thiosulfate/3-mercaptopyruvate sulfurtransferase